MAQFELIMFATNVEIQRIDDAGSSSPGNYFLSLPSADLEIVIEKSSWIDRKDFPVFSQVLNCEIRELDFLAKPVFHTRPVRNLLPEAACPQLTGPEKANKAQKRKTRVE